MDKVIDQILKLFVGTFVPLILAFGVNASQPSSFEPQWRELISDGSYRVELYFFWSKTCPHCQEALPHIEQMAMDHPWLRLHSMEITRHPDHRSLYLHYAEYLGESARSVPAFFVCNSMTVGWDGMQGIGQHLLSQARLCREGEIPNKPQQDQQASPLQTLQDMNLDQMSLPAITVVLAGLDAFNPCAFFILLFLLSLLVHARSRRRMLFIGLTFVTMSGVIYFLFMAAWLNLFLLVGSMPYITLTAGIVALLIGILNAREYFKFHQGPSLSIPDGAKPGLFKRMTRLISVEHLPTLLFGTVMLAAAVNLYELLCTAGFPMVYTRLLTLHQLQGGAYYGYLLLYNLIYIIPLLVIVLVFTWTLGSRKLSQSEGRLLKLLSGSMMLMLGLALIINPNWLNQLTSGVILLAGALALTALAWLWDKYY